MADDQKAVFLASFPPIQSAIKVYGDKQGMRVQFDIPESEMANALALLTWRECVLEVTVKPAGVCFTGYNTNALGKGTKRKPEWQTTEEPLSLSTSGEGG
jgi:hypothetical protein